jgi:CRISPR system Cascade subunit CasE
MTTLTRLQLDPRHRDVRRDLADIHRLHRRIMSLLADGLGDNPRQAGGALWRLEPNTTPLLLVQTAEPPAIDRLPAGYADAQSRDLGSVLSAIRPGLRLRYRVTVNPVQQNGNTGRRTAVPRAALPEWWAKRTARIGLDDIAPAAFTSEPTRHGTTPAGNRLTIAAARIDGTATVTDPELLRQALIDGVGRGRSYGCGLLTIAPL